MEFYTTAFSCALDLCTRNILLIPKTVKVKNGLFLWHNYEEENNIKKLKNNKNNKIRKAQTSVHINLNI